MKPLNLNTTGCDPISSNCVIWQGPDIPCIKLCKGDTVSDVVFKLATELCDVLDQLDVSTYNLPSDCFENQQCNPSNFHDLIQIIIDKICECDCTASAGLRVGDTSGGCPDCVVPIAKCFYYTNEFGDLVTTMQLTDYVRTVGNKLCEIVNSVLILTQAVNDLDLRVTALENAPEPTVLLPQVTPTCVILPPAPTDMSLVLSVLEQQFCQLVSVTGNPVNLGQAIGAQCSGLNTSEALGTSGGTMSTIPGWIISANTVAASLNNMWLTICDLRSAVRNMQLTCCPSGCDGIDITLTATLVGPNLTLYFSGSIPTGFTDCSPSGNTFKITDALGSSISVNIDTVNYINFPGGFVIDIGSTVLNPVLDMTITSDLCYTNPSTNTTCQFCITYNLTNSAGCPQLVIIPNITGDGVSVQFNPVSVPGTYTVEIWDSLFLAVVATQTQLLTAYGLTTYNFVGLNPSTVYNVRLVITIGGNTRNCPYAPFTTNPVLCLPASAVTTTVNTPVLCDTCGPAIDFVDNITVDGTYVSVTLGNTIEVVGGVPVSETPCTQGRVSMYLGNAGPYEYNAGTTSWDAMCTSSALGSTPSPGLFTVTALFNASVVSGALLYSVNGGVTWIPLIDNSGDLYANPGTWLAGRVYNNPAAAFDLKITFSTDDDCGLEGPLMSLP